MLVGLNRMYVRDFTHRYRHRLNRRSKDHASHCAVATYRNILAVFLQKSSFTLLMECRVVDSNDYRVELLNDFTSSLCCCLDKAALPQTGSEQRTAYSRSNTNGLNNNILHTQQEICAAKRDAREERIRSSHSHTY